jgi:3-phosphoshikimate 1-carboxyvinyltransferase
LRFFIPICLLADSKIKLLGSERLLQRPLNVYEDICAEKGMFFMHNENEVEVCGPLKAGVYKLAGNVSSQFVTGLLFALPLLQQDSRIEITPPVESRSYINMTVSALDMFGVRVYWEDENTLVIPGNQEYGAKEVTVEGDYSNAAFLDALNLFGGEVKVGNLATNSLQGDRMYTAMYDRLKVSKPELNLSDCPDLGPILFAVASALDGGVFTGTARLRIKESDRATVMAEELKKFGVNVVVKEDQVVVDGGNLSEPLEELYGYNDHRIVMSMAVLATIKGGTISGAQAVNKSFPDFFEKISSLGIEVNILED